LDIARQIAGVKVGSEPSEVPPTPTLTTYGLTVIETVDLLDVVVGDGYVGPAWDELQRRLVVRAFSDLERAIRSGAIYQRCARARVRIPRRPELQRYPYPDDIAAEAVEDCLDRFRTRILPEGQWDPDKGTSLEDFFVACCLPDVANRWRWHLRHLLEYSVPLEVVEEEKVRALPANLAPGPPEIVEDRALVTEAAAPMASADQTAFVLLAAGWRPEEIARALGIGRGALYARVSRARKAARTRRTP
jgi:DNA-directed RNA polymerase specialized sigma24 family protein